MHKEQTNRSLELAPPRPLKNRSPGEPQQEFVALGHLMAALAQVARKGPGIEGWAMVHQDPLAFLMDAISDALLVRSLDGTVLFANSLAVELQLCERRFSAYEEFVRSGDRFVVRGLRLRSREGELSFTLVARARTMPKKQRR